MHAQLSPSCPVALLYRGAAGTAKGLLWVSAACVAVMVSITMSEIILRYFFNIPLPWANEAARTLFVWSVMLGIAVATWSKVHIAVTMLGDVWLPALKLGGRVVAGCGILTLSLLLAIEGTYFAQVNLTNITSGLGISLAVATSGIAVGGLFMSLFSVLSLLEEFFPSFREAARAAGSGRRSP